MIPIIDANYFINGQLNDIAFSKRYTTSLVWEEIKDTSSAEYANFNKYRIDIRDPKCSTIAAIKETLADKNLLLSEADISLVGLCVDLNEELFDSWQGPSSGIDNNIVCLSNDHGLLQAISYFNLKGSKKVMQKDYKFRCYVCFEMYEASKDFCKKCGYQTLSRVSVSEVDGKLKVHLKKGYVAKNKQLKDNHGRIIRGEDQREYKKYKKGCERKERKIERVMSDLRKNI